MHQWGFTMMIINLKVIYTDGTEGTVDASDFVKLLRSKKLRLSSAQKDGWRSDELK